ncbi:MAG TPA: hypothetical protein VGM23_01150, partial [Armatimonadota bacterium]
MENNTSSLASMVTDLLHRYLTQQDPQAFAQSVGHPQPEQVTQQAQGLWQTVRERLGQQPESSETVQHFEQDPEQHHGQMQGVLEQHLSRDPGFLNQVLGYLQQMR